jgi:hypothetical protein
VRSEQSPAFADKWLLDLEIVDSKTLRGGNFARSGQKVKAFAVEPPEGLSEGCTITAQAEFLGNPRGGQFRLTDIQVESGEQQQ